MSRGGGCAYSLGIIDMCDKTNDNVILVSHMYMTLHDNVIVLSHMYMTVHDNVIVLSHSKQRQCDSV